MKAIVLDHNTWGKPHWEQDLRFELETIRRAGGKVAEYCHECARDCANPRDHKINCEQYKEKR
jgi:hypothetical protein